MSARVAPHAIALAMALLLSACTGQEQSLGGASTTAPAPVPTTWIASHSLCPPTRPAEGSACATYDDADAAVARQCRYAASDDPGCQSVCVCGYNGGWSCFHAACGILTEYACEEGGPCNDGVGCSTPTHDCRCVGDELSCAPVSNP